MSESDLRIAALEARLDALVRSQIDFQSEITSIRKTLHALREAGRQQPVADNVQTLEPTLAPEQTFSVDSGVHREEPASQTAIPAHGEYPVHAEMPPPTFGSGNTQTTGDRATRPNSGFSNFAAKYAASARGDLEKFIGENLISLIGVIVLVLGVGIGAKYAIDNGWISPIIRVVFGYVMGFGLVGFAVRLKAKYHDFSAVLLSGGMAIMYFVTYFAYAYYSLMPQSAAFALMAIFTVFTVVAATIFDRQVIAHIGLVGAYAVPFLLSNNSGNYLFLFSYMTIINVGVLAISVTKYWKLLYYSAFAMTWIIYLAWFGDKYAAADHFSLAMAFAAIFFVIFYVTKLIHGFHHSEHELAEGSIALLSNSFIFYGFGMAIMESRAEMQPFEGLFTAGHALLHSLSAQIINRFRPEATGLIRVLAALIITFVTIAIPVQFDGKTVTLVWSVEAAVLFWMGRARTVFIFKYLAYPLMGLATVSLCVDWLNLYAERSDVVSELNRRPLANGEFVTALIFVAAFAAICWVDRRWRDQSVLDEELSRAVGMIIATVTVLALYNLFRIEIGNYYHLQLVGRESVYQISSLFEPNLRRSSDDLVRFNAIWQLNYTMVFLAGLAAVNLGRLRSSFTAIADVALSGTVLAVFLTVGMYFLYELRVSYMAPDPSAVAPAGAINIAIRYISYLAAAAMLAGMFFTVRSQLVSESISEKVRDAALDVLLCVSIWVAASCELINLMAQVHVPNSTKLGLSILWGIYALVLIVIGIATNKKHLRVGAIFLLAITLAKLFLYDVADLPTIPKTALFVSLGILLLLISFLYNKFTAKIFGRAEPDD